MPEPKKKSGVEENGKNVRKFWFDGLTPEEQDAIIRPLFEEAHPTDADKRERTREYEEF